MMVGRVESNNSYTRKPAWCWVRQKEDGTLTRVTWVFQTVDKAHRWRENKYWRYAKFKSIEDYLSTVADSRKVYEARRWEDDSRIYNSLHLYRAYTLLPKLVGIELAGGGDYGREEGE